MDVGRDIDEAYRDGVLVVPDKWAGLPQTAFGGFLCAAALRIASRESGQPQAISLLGRYFRATPVGKGVRIDHEREHEGRRLESYNVRLWDDDRLLATFSIQFGEGRHEPYTSQGLDAPPPVGATRPVHELLTNAGQEPPAHMVYTGFEEAVECDLLPPGTLANRWPAKSGEIALAAVMCVDNFVGPATWRTYGESEGTMSAVLLSVDIAVWFHDLDVPGGWLDSRTRIVAANRGIATGQSQVWRGERLVATGASTVTAVPVA
ncbi:MAG: thioesterase family protein [Deltaproteobacteria bacterium]|nr:thioesterase family protein [Deltaproteobacteria bacterium]